MKIIEYYPGNSIIHRLDPRTKLLALAILTCTIYSVKNFYIIAGLFIAFLLMWKISSLPLKMLKGYFKFLVSMFIFIVAVQAFFGNGTASLITVPESFPVMGGWHIIKYEGLITGLLLSMRLLTLVILMPIVTMTTPVHILSLGLMKIGIGYKIAYMATTAINLIPSFQTEIGIIRDAQKMRGLTAFESGSMVQKFKSYPALVVPLVISAMRKAQLMGVAMDSRAFGAFKKRTNCETITLIPLDYIIMLLSICVGAGLICLNTFVL